MDSAGVITVSIERFACAVDDPCAVALSAPVCGGRRFRRHFNKRDFPVLGDDYEDSIDRFVQIGSYHRYRKSM